MASSTRSPSSGSNATGIGTVAWTSPGAVTADDQNYAAASSLTAGATTNWLKIIFDFSSLPSGSTINGIEISLNHYESTAPLKLVYTAMRLVIGNTIQTPNVDNMPTAEWSTVTGENTVTAGGSANKWGVNPSYADVSGANFGIALAVKSNEASKSRTAQIDYASCTVYYSSSNSYQESIDLQAGGNCGSAPQMSTTLGIGLSATAATSEGGAAGLSGGVSFGSLAGLSEETLAAIQGLLAVDSVAAAGLIGGLQQNGSLDLSSISGLSGEMIPVFAGLLNLAVSHEFQVPSQLTAAATLALDAKIEEAYIARGLLRAALPLHSQGNTSVIGGSVFEFFVDFVAQPSISSSPATSISSTALLATIANLLGFEGRIAANGSLVLGSKDALASAAAGSLQLSFILGLSSRLHATASVGVVGNWATSIQSVIEAAVRQSEVCRAVVTAGLGTESLSLLHSTSRVAITMWPNITDSAGVDYRRQVSIAVGSALGTKATKVYDSLIVLGIEPMLSALVVASLREVASLAATASSQTDSMIRAVANIGLAVEQTAGLQKLLGVSVRGNLAMRSQLASEVRGDWIRLVNLAQRLSASSRTTGAIDEGILIGIEQAFVSNVRAMLAGAIAVSVSPIIETQLKLYNEAIAALGVRPEVSASSIGHFRAAVVAAVVTRLVAVNFDPQVIRIVSELLSRSAVTDEGLKVSRIVDETIVRAE